MRQKIESRATSHIQSKSRIKYRWLQFALLGSALLFAGCLADTHEGLIKAQFAAQEDLFKILEDIKDKKTATQAAPKLERIVKRLKDLDERAKKLDPPDIETMQKIVKLRSELAMKQMQNMNFNQKALSDPEVAKVLADVMKKIQKANP